MAKKTIRPIVLLGMFGALAWYLWLGLTTISANEYSSPWEDNLPIVIVAVTVGWPLLAAAGIFGSVRLRGNSRAMRSAELGIGTVTGVRRTGLTVNDKPQLAIGMTVRTKSGQTFDSVAKQLVDLTELSILVPGAVLPVRYRPEHLEEVEIDQSGDQAAIQEVHNQVLIRAGLSSARSVDIAARGTRAEAVVSAVRPTGQIVCGNPQMALTLLVNRPDGSNYETTVEKVIAANLVGHLQLGRVVTVFYLPGDEGEVALQLPANPHV
jgi:hypothetical protein